MFFGIIKEPKSNMNCSIAQALPVIQKIGRPVSGSPKWIKGEKRPIIGVRFCRVATDYGWPRVSTCGLGIKPFQSSRSDRSQLFASPATKRNCTRCEFTMLDRSLRDKNMLGSSNHGFKPIWLPMSSCYASENPLI